MANYAIAVKKSTGWTMLLTESGDVLVSTNADSLLSQVSSVYPPTKIKLFEVMNLSTDYTWSGGSTSNLAINRENMKQDLLELTGE